MPGEPVSPPVGSFGKLPGLGDFLTRDLPAPFTEAWHAWLATELPAARAALGVQFEDAYLQAPVWRFALPARAAGPWPMTGLLMPSVDAVGREFPLTLAARGAAAPANWYDALEDVARAALAEDWAMTPWLTALAALEAPQPGAAPPSQVTLWSDGSPFVVPATLFFDRLPTGPDFRRLLIDTVEVAA